MLRIIIIAAALASVPMTTLAQNVPLTSSVPVDGTLPAATGDEVSPVDFQIDVPANGSAHVLVVLPDHVVAGMDDLWVLYLTPEMSLARRIAQTNPGIYFGAIPVGDPGGLVHIRLWNASDAPLGYQLVATVAGPSVEVPMCMADAYDGKAGNDTLLTATPVKSPAVIDASVCAGDLDYYVLALPLDCAMEITLSFEQRTPLHAYDHTTDLGDLTLGLFDAKGAPIDEAATDHSPEQLIVPAGIGGMVYVGVYGADDGQTMDHYRLTITSTCGAIKKSTTTSKTSDETETTGLPTLTKTSDTPNETAFSASRE